MSEKKNVLWRFFASVKLALISLIILAITSVLGTLVKQGQGADYYIQEYGSGLARFFEMSDITNMYSSWWFVALLCLFAVNLVVCSIERLPGVWRQMTMDNLAIDPGHLEKMGLTYHADSKLSPAGVAERITRLLSDAGWKKHRKLEREADAPGGQTFLISVQKGSWSRLGVYIVHLSILVILIGAITGSIFGFQAYVFIPEGKATGNVFLRETKESFPLDFRLQCDRFEKDFYPNGMIKQYRADLTVLDPERKTPYQKTIVVNDPLNYKGLAFYIGDSYPMDAFFIVVRNQKTGMEQAFRVPPEQDVAWQGTDVSFRIEELRKDQDGAVDEAKIRFMTDGADEPSLFWMQDKTTTIVQQIGGDLSFSFRQLYSTLFLVTRDPGVWIVYSGFMLIIAGLAVSFFLSHRRIWVYISPQSKHGSRILVCGVANKHKPVFERKFQKIVSLIAEDDAFFAGNESKL